MNEIWKDIKDYEGLYQVSNIGNVKSLARVVSHKITGHRTIPEKILKPNSDGAGYLYVSLSRDGKKKNPKIHRLVAEAFIPNSENLPQVNHIDEDKSNNRVTNLEWSTSLNNLNYSNVIEKGNSARKKKVIQRSFDGEVIAIYPSMAEAVKTIGVNNHSLISMCCSGKRKSAYNYLWEYG